MLNWPPDPDQIPLLPVETLALSLLSDIARQPGRAMHRNSYVGINGKVPSRGLGYNHPSVLEAVNEAWDWLYINGLMVGASGDWNLPGERMEGYRVISRKGRELLTRDDPMSFVRVERLLTLPLHPRIEAKARIQFAIGAYDSAVHEAFKELEIRVRDAGGFPARTLGDSLMRLAFNPDNGPLTNTSLVSGERRAIMELYAGAIGAFKNPLSHRTVDYEDPQIAAEQLLFADLLHRMLDSSESSINTPE